MQLFSPSNNTSTRRDKDLARSKDMVYERESKGSGIGAEALPAYNLVRMPAISAAGAAAPSI